ncbi:cytochrome oxidase [Saccharospirillum sp. MSK14-1]|nr:cbb3-type cytochrome c oxidase subunit 3 [Saccharospirillum sp. MSK14-1]PTY37350.1 cytochrome oxidase [Saccharospirillum sp. MSK14-1]
MDINTLRGLATVFTMIAFFGVVYWAYSSKRKARFDDAANLPFADRDEQMDAASDKKRNDDE